MTRNPRARWVLPTTVNPSTSKCIQVPVPNDPHHIAAFRGAMLALASAANWGNDTAHTAKDVAAVWRAIIDTMDWGCTMFDVRQNEDLPCHLDKSIDGGTTWEQWADLQKCPPKIRTNKGALQFWDGAAWVALPGSGDERQDGTYTPPWPTGTVPSGQSAQCLSAENILSVYSTTLTKMRADIAAAKLAVEVSAGITFMLGVFIEPALISTIALALAGLALSAGTSVLDTLLGSTPLDKIRCNLFLHAGADGSFTASAYNAFYAQLATDFTDSTQLSIIRYYFDCLGPVGITRQGKAQGITSANCDDCYALILTAGTTPYIGVPGTLSTSHVNVGDTFTFQPGHQGSGIYDGIWSSNHQATFRITAVSNYTPRSGYDWQWVSPDELHTGAPNVGDTKSCGGWAGNSDTSYTITYIVDSIP